MTFQDCLSEQFKLHPSMQCVDVVKLCYQAAFGAEHLLTDVTAAKVYFDQEYADVALIEKQQNNDSFIKAPLIEYISPDVARVNFVPWIAAGKDKEALFEMFVKSASVQRGGEAQFRKYIDEASCLIKDGASFIDNTTNLDDDKKRFDNQLNIGFSDELWGQFLNHYFAEGIHAVHHSKVYEKVEHPAYRIVCVENLIK